MILDPWSPFSKKPLKIPLWINPFQTSLYKLCDISLWNTCGLSLWKNFVRCYSLLALVPRAMVKLFPSCIWWRDSVYVRNVLLPARKRFRFRFKQYFQYLLWKNWNVGHLLQGEESIRKSTELNLILLNLGSIKHGWIHWSNTKGKLDNTKVLNSRERITRVKFCNLRHMYGHILFFSAGASCQFEFSSNKVTLLALLRLEISQNTC